MSWQRRARLVVAVAGLSVAVALVVFSRRREAGAPIAAPTLSDPNATSEASHETTIRFDAGREAFELTADHRSTYPDGHNRYEGHVKVTIRREDRTYSVEADTVEEHGKATAASDQPGELVLTGHVRLSTGDGLVVSMAAATYDNVAGVLTVPGPLDFTRDWLSGSASGAVYDRRTDTLTLRDAAHVVVAPDEAGGGAADLKSRTMALDRPAHQVRMTDHAAIVRPEETLTADRSVLHFTDDEQGLRLLELRGHARVVPSDPSSGGPPDMRADDIDLSFQADGRTLQHATLTRNAVVALSDSAGRHTVAGQAVDLATAADGRTLTRLTGRERVGVTLPPGEDTPARTITAQALTASGDESGLKNARFTGSVRFVETRPASGDTPAGERTATSRTLNLALLGGLEAIDQAEFLDEVDFHDGDVHATADRAEYLVKDGELRLFPAARTARRLPHVEDTRVSVDADAITLRTETHDLTAEGAVKTRMLPSASDASEDRPPALFESGKTVWGIAARLEYASAARTAHYTGSPTARARVWQDNNRIDADDIRVEDQTGNLHAAGHVESLLLLSDPPSEAGQPAPAPTPRRANGAEMTYVDDQRLATYLGAAEAPASLAGADGTVTARQIQIYLAREQRSIDRVESDADVFVQLNDGGEAIGDHLTYRSAADQYVLRGSPAQVKIKQADGRCARSTNPGLVFNRTGAVEADPSSG